jgi:hypothetical protein
MSKSLNYIVIEGQRYDYVKMRKSDLDDSCGLCEFRNNCGNEFIPCSPFTDLNDNINRYFKIHEVKHRIK